MQSDNNKINVMLVDDHPMLQDGLIACLSYYDDIAIVGTCNDGQNVLTKAMACQPDVILMDISMPHMNGLDATEVLKDKLANTKVLIFSMHDNAKFVISAVQAGASGYILKDTSSEEVYQAIKAVQQGKSYFSSSIAQVLLDNPSEQESVYLTTREQVILSHIASGKSSKEIAQTLDISYRTVEAHRRNIKQKLQIDSLAELVRYAVSQGLVEH